MKIVRNSAMSLTLALVTCADKDRESTAAASDIGGVTEDGKSDNDSDSDSDSSADESGEKLDLGEQGSGNPDGDGDGEAKTNKIDILFVIDNSGSTGQEQANLAHNFPLLVQQLQNLTDTAGDPIAVDVQIMVTTTDMQHSNCMGTSGATDGQPVTTACTTRLGDFVFAGANEQAACTDNCPVAVVPDGPFLWFHGNQDNVPDVPDADVNGDGVADNAAAQALACVGPQGTTGCWYEAPLDAMMAAIDPEAPHNQGEKPFIRRDAVLAVTILTDEADCSIDEIAHPEVWGTEELWNTDPDFGVKATSSGICWNAGIECSGGPGTYDDCVPTDEPMVNIGTYKDYLTGLIENEDKEVVMLGIIGVPVVTEHDPDPPHLPTAGGVDDLIYRDWEDGIFPNGDILPGEIDTAADLQFRFSIGPGCTEVYDGDRKGQAVPAPRIISVCQSLDGVTAKDDDDENRIRCCIESICDDDFSAAITCLTGLIGETVVTPE